ncbi:MAG: hypothetical protein ABIL45_03445 [candidate division WOR-3 bacterium]
MIGIKIEKKTKKEIEATPYFYLVFSSFPDYVPAEIVNQFLNLLPEKEKIYEIKQREGRIAKRLIEFIEYRLGLFYSQYINVEKKERIKITSSQLPIMDFETAKKWEKFRKKYQIAIVLFKLDDVLVERKFIIEIDYKNDMIVDIIFPYSYADEREKEFFETLRNDIIQKIKYENENWSSIDFSFVYVKVLKEKFNAVRMKKNGQVYALPSNIDILKIKNKYSFILPIYEAEKKELLIEYLLEELVEEYFKIKEMLEKGIKVQKPLNELRKKINIWKQTITELEELIKMNEKLKELSDTVDII